MGEKDTKKSKFIALFVEGDTDKVFFENMIGFLKEKNKKVVKHRIYNVKGIGNYASRVPGKFKNEILPKYSEYRIIVFCSYDVDVFKFSAKLPVNWDKINKELIEYGAEDVNFMKAINMIEDWFLYDLEGICKYLKIEKPKKVKGKNGFEKMKFLFKRANRVYQKGAYTERFLDKINYNKIYTQIKKEIKSFEEELFSL